MEVIKPSWVKSIISGALFGGVGFTARFSYQIFKADVATDEAYIWGIPITAALCALTFSIFALKYNKVSVGKKTASQVASAITFQSARIQRNFLGLKAVDDMGGKIRCLSIVFSNKDLDRLEEIIIANQSSDPT